MDNIKIDSTQSNELNMFNEGRLNNSAVFDERIDNRIRGIVSRAEEISSPVYVALVYLGAATQVVENYNLNLEQHVEKMSGFFFFGKKKVGEEATQLNSLGAADNVLMYVGGFLDDLIDNKLNAKKKETVEEAQKFQFDMYANPTVLPEIREMVYDAMVQLKEVKEKLLTHYLGYNPHLELEESEETFDVDSTNFDLESIAKRTKYHVNYNVDSVMNVTNIFTSGLNRVGKFANKSLIANKNSERVALPYAAKFLKEYIFAPAEKIENISLQEEQEKLAAHTSANNTNNQAGHVLRLF
jgi:hypothetical protein